MISPIAHMKEIKIFGIVIWQQGNCGDELGCNLVGKCVRDIPLRKEIEYSVNEPEYGLKGDHLKNTIERLGPGEDEHGITCERPLRLEIDRIRGRWVDRRNRRSRHRSG